jgi:hypothetical protein
MATVEATRARFRPERITTLFVGESAPASGDFFYHGKNAMLSHLQRAVEQSLGPSGDFLARFKGYGWFLDDLVLEPVDKLSPRERAAKCLGARASLADRIAKYQPLAIVTMLLRITNHVDAAAIAANCTAPRYIVPFPGMGQQVRFRAAMAQIIPKLPRKAADLHLDGRSEASPGELSDTRDLPLK